jgi:N-acyl-D-aspartate/D-glutamate deacylase
LSNFVREKAILSLEEAIHKATQMPAQRFGIKGRGVLEPGAYADVVLLNPDTIMMVGDFLQPDRAPAGIHYVFVNGKIVYKGNAPTGERPGRVLRKNN